MWGHVFLWWLISLGILFFVVYEAVYLAMARALREHRDQPPAQTAPPPQTQPPS